VAGDRRPEEEIRREIASEREALVSALADLRQGVDEKRKLAAVVGGALTAAFAAVAALRLGRRLRG
jgi:hypothetical protein